MKNTKCLGFVLVFSEKKRHIETISEGFPPPTPWGSGVQGGVKLTDI